MDHGSYCHSRLFFVSCLLSRKYFPGLVLGRASSQQKERKRGSQWRYCRDREIYLIPAAITIGERMLRCLTAISRERGSANARGRQVAFGSASAAKRRQSPDKSLDHHCDALYTCVCSLHLTARSCMTKYAYDGFMFQFDYCS